VVRFRRVRPSQDITGTWEVNFVEGGPVLPAAYTTTNLASWTSQDDPEAKRFAGTARYTIGFDHPAGEADDWILDWAAFAKPPSSKSTAT